MIRAASLILLCAAVQAQQFEVASIKEVPVDPRGYSVWSKGGPGTQDPSLFSCHNYSAGSLVMMAFDLKTYELSGLDWGSPPRYDVSAKVPEGTTREQFRQMMQNLLIERFKLTFHREKKEVPSYNLVVAKGGPKFKESVPEPPPSDDVPKPSSGPLKKDATGYPILPAGRDSTMAIMNGYASQRFGNEPITQLVANLGFQLHKPITNSTGLTGKYDFELHWAADPKLEDTEPNLFRALTEQLGLKLESSKTMVEILVVDHIEKSPTEN